MLGRPSQANKTIKGARSTSHRRVSEPGSRPQSKFKYDPSFIQQAAQAVRNGQEKVFLAKIESEEEVS